MESVPYHIPVLLKEAVDALVLNPDGVYVDATFGGGGHSKEVLSRLTGGRLFAFDQDPAARDNVVGDSKLQFVAANFRYVKKFLRVHGVDGVDGVLADLGVSSRQFDDQSRGFSIRFDADLDMRMDQGCELTGSKILNEYEESSLADVLWKYGELKESRKVARAIVKARESVEIKTSGQLKEVLSKFSGFGKENQFMARVFQALRIEVNDEITALYEFLNQCVEILNPGGRLVVISYHSLEDRLVKNLMKHGNLEGKVEKDFYGNKLSVFKELVRKPIVPNQQEIESNGRARSAKMRIAEKLAEV